MAHWPDDLGLVQRGMVVKPLFTEWERQHPINRHLALKNIAIEKAAGFRPICGQRLVFTLKHGLPD